MPSSEGKRTLLMPSFFCFFFVRPAGAYTAGIEGQGNEAADWWCAAARGRSLDTIITGER